MIFHHFIRNRQPEQKNEKMSEQAPDSCPFCGAGIRIEKDGTQCRAPRGTWVGFSCFTTWHHGYHDPRKLQSVTCIEAERERLTRERDNLLAQVKRLEEALEACDWAFTKFCPEHESRYGDAWEKARDALNRPNPFKSYWPEDKP